MKVTVVQPDYYIGTCPDAQNRAFIIDQMEQVIPGELIVFPEYSNAGGLSEPEAELAALPTAKELLEAASRVSGDRRAYVAVNVLERREDIIRNSTYLYDTKGQVAFVYDKQHLPPSEVELGVVPGGGAGYDCICDLDGIRFAFMTCYDVYFNEQIEWIAARKPDVILVPGYQRGERTDIIRAQYKLLAFRCNSFVVRASFSMRSEEKGGCSMIVAPDGQILADLGSRVGSVSAEIDPSRKYLRSAGFGGKMVRNDDFIRAGLRNKH